MDIIMDHAQPSLLDEQCDDFCDKLIELVQKHEAIYDCTSPHYKNYNFIYMLWEMIGSQLNVSAAKCKRKWKGLRDTYVRKRKLMRTNNSNAGSRVEKWKYLSKLTFLENHIRERENDCPEYLVLPDRPMEENGERFKVNDEHDSNEDSSSVASVSVINDLSPEQANGQDRLKNEFEMAENSSPWKYDIEDLVMEDQRITYKEEDYHFMMSMLPVLAKLPDHVRNDVKFQIYQVLYHAEKKLRDLKY